MTLAKICATAIELDEKRTQGEWVWNASHGLHDGAVVDTLKGEFVAECAFDNNFGLKDAKFIAHAANNHALLARACLKAMDKIDAIIDLDSDPANHHKDAARCAICLAREARSEIDALFEKGE